MAVIKLTTELAHEEYLAKEVLLERAGKWVKIGRASCRERV